MVPWFHAAGGGWLGRAGSHRGPALIPGLPAALPCSALNDLTSWTRTSSPSVRGLGLSDLGASCSIMIAKVPGAL